MRFAVLLATLGALGGCKGDETEPFRDVELAPPEDGFQLVVEPFVVPYGKDVQDCYFFEVPFDEPVCVNRVVVAQNPGTHHMNMFRPELGTVKDLYGEPGDVVHGTTDDRTTPCWESSNWSDWPLLVNDQESDAEDGPYEWTLPENVVHVLRPRERLMLQTHYVNASTQAGERGKVLVNFERVPCEDTVELGTIFATNQSIRVCPDNPTPTYASSCGTPFDEPITITAANSHFHSRGRHFALELYDPVSDTYSEPFYENTAWDDPYMGTDLNVHVEPGMELGWHCTYQYVPPPAGLSCDDLGDGCCYEFGNGVDDHEHCNVFLYYYPKLVDYSCR